MPAEVWVKSPQALAGCGVQETLVITKADGSVRAHLRCRGKEMEQKETPELTWVLTSHPALEVCRSQWTIARPGGKAGGVKMIEGQVPHYPGLPWQGCKVPSLRKILSCFLNHLGIICFPPVMPGHCSLITPNNSSCNLAANVDSQFPSIPPGCSTERGKTRVLQQAHSIFREKTLFLKDIFLSKTKWLGLFPV